MPEREFSLIVVGVPYENKGPGARAFEVAMCQPGEPIELRPEPRNRHDRHAIAVYSSRGIQLGYVTAERAPWIGTLIAQGCVAIFQQALAQAAVIRVRFGGGTPTLPPERSIEVPHRIGTRRGPDDFYPDPELSEWGA